MNVVTIILIAVGLAMDAFSVAIAAGVIERNATARHALRMALFFGAFQAIMPVLGWLVAHWASDYVTQIAPWISFLLLGGVGAKMVYEAFQFKEQENQTDYFAWRTLCLLGIATSVDALAVGVSFSLLAVKIIMPSVIIGLVAFFFSVLGVYLGKRIGHWLETKIEVVGGLLLIGIGFEILIQHLMG